jgi:acyl-CoA synthetase (AMP-forming)/AMP-acid ligase II
MLLNQNCLSLSLQPKSTLTDGQLTCSWLDILDILEKLSIFFVQRQIEITDCLALEIDNSLPTALILLYLLEKEYSFFLLPKTANSSPIPRFCRYQVISQFGNQGKLENLTEFENWLNITENEQWQPLNDGGKKLYLRTSGSTGNPKIVVHSQAKLLENAFNCVERLELSPDDRVAIPVPIYHMYGLGAAFLPSVAVGASIDLQKGANLLRYLQREKDFNPNVAFMTPSFCETLLKGRKSPREYKLTVVAGDHLKETTFVQYEANFGCLVKLYGSTEMGAIAAGSPTEALEVRCQTVGLPMTGVQLRVTPPESSPIPGVGEIWCQHPSGFQGYVDAEGKPLTPNQDTQNTGFETKDLGKLRTDGYLEVWGRCDRSVNRDGLLVLFADIEKAMETLPGIETVVVESYGETQRGKGLVAFCILAKGTNLKETEIRGFCFDVLPKRAIPDQVFILKTLPILSNGKIDRQQLIQYCINSQQQT